MNPAETVLARSPFGHAQADKDIWLREGLHALTRHHRDACPAYDGWVRAMFPAADRAASLAELPWLPVGVFKSHLLSSVPPDSVVRTLTSSGTTGQAVSRIPLDAATAARQGRALSGIMQAVLGPKRLPMLIVDRPDAIAGAGTLSARGAAIIGMMPFGRDHTFLLDPAKGSPAQILERFVDRHGSAPFLILGMTATVWRHLPEAAGAALAQAILIHGGGWKTLAAEGVGNAEFKAELARRGGLGRVVNFYGMAEQVGSIFLEGEDGLLHAPAAADVIIRDPATLAECPVGTPGVIQVVSLLPTSYPGHSILTEDWGVVDSVDGGAWKGKAFRVLGRVPRVELRGCSDVAAAAAGGRSMSLRRLAPAPRDIRAEDLLADLGDAPPPFDTTTENLGRALSERLLRHPSLDAHPDLAALGFWLRPASTRIMRRHLDALGPRQGRGRALHIAPANVETLFIYSWWISILCGNANLVRVSSRAGERSRVLLALLNEILDLPGFARLRSANAFIAFDHDDDETARTLSAACQLRVVWGGDATVTAFAALPLAEGGFRLDFPDRRSASAMAARAYLDLDAAGRDELARRFFNDGYWFDQKACSSPLLLAWIGDEDAAARASADFWPRLATWIERNGYDPATATSLAQLTEAARLALDGTARAIRRIRPGLTVVEVAPAPPRPETCGGGLFEQCRVERPEDLAGLVDWRLQTVTHFGLDDDSQNRLAPLLAERGGAERLTPVGTALDFSHVWDGKDLLAGMTRPLDQ